MEVLLIKGKQVYARYPGREYLFMIDMIYNFLRERIWKRGGLGGEIVFCILI